MSEGYKDSEKIWSQIQELALRREWEVDKFHELVDEVENDLTKHYSFDAMTDEQRECWYYNSIFTRMCKASFIARSHQIQLLTSSSPRS